MSSVAWLSQHFKDAFCYCNDAMILYNDGIWSPYLPEQYFIAVPHCYGLF